MIFDCMVFHFLYAVPAKVLAAHRNVLSRPLMMCADRCLSVPWRASAMDLLLCVLPLNQSPISPLAIKIHKFASMGYANVIGCVS